MRSIKVTDTESVCGYNKHCDHLTKPLSSCVNKDAIRKVPFPRSNSIRIINVQYPKGVRKLNYFAGDTAKELEKTQNSTDRILRQNRFEMNQSVSRVFDQSATPPSSQSQQRVSVTTDQSEAAWASPDFYKRRRKVQFVSRGALPSLP